ncbi:CaiB/BaiF CoA transferase family protein [Sphingobium phenoxybenzoativorans]|uniref:CaiB/BaiF CoA transferase family protein n=1 Tax=Sphingobium phenoxybenzoativorans TaxID=1592790 RepID=UPI000871E9E3|nr:CaiB/BaiF CoA-transferase family protein [Sphingobium phenoxybenzoativorans]
MSTSSGALSNWAGPLQGTRVIDLTRILSGPFATQMLGDLGAEIIKIERPGTGDETRGFAPFIGGESHYFLGVNRNKKSLALDLSDPRGRDILIDLVREADVLIENFRPGVMERLGLSYAVLAEANPRLVYCAISGFGQDGPLRDAPAFDIVIQALTGVLSLNGEPGGVPTKLGIPLGDMAGGLFGAIAILAALNERASTGAGRQIDVSLFDSLIGMLGYYAQLAFVTGRDPEPTGSRHPNIVPYGVYPASDGTMVIACLTQIFWVKLCAGLGISEMAEDPRFATVTGRVAHRDIIDAAVSERTRTFTVQQLGKILQDADIPSAPILGVTAALTHPQSVARNMVVEVDHSSAGDMKMTGRSIKFPGSPQSASSAPPRIGENGPQILRDLLGMSDGDIARLADAKVIETPNSVLQESA